MKDGAIRKKSNLEWEWILCGWFTYISLVEWWVEVRKKERRGREVRGDSIPSVILLFVHTNERVIVLIPLWESSDKRDRELYEWWVVYTLSNDDSITTYILTQLRWLSIGRGDWIPLLLFWWSSWFFLSLYRYFYCNFLFISHINPHIFTIWSVKDKNKRIERGWNSSDWMNSLSGG